MKLCPDGGVCIDYRDVHNVTVKRNEHSILTETPGLIGSGKNGGFQALNIAIQFGAKRIVLVGYDMQLGPNKEPHWHGRHPGKLSNPLASTLATWRGIIDGQVKRLKELGVEVINASPTSALQSFPKMGLIEALDRLCPSPPV